MVEDKLSLKTILIIDDSSRKKIKLNLSDLSMYDVQILGALSEIKDYMLVTTKRVVILEDFVKNKTSLSDLKLYKEVFGIEFVYIGSNDVWLKVISSHATCYKMDIATLDYDKLYSIVFRDSALLNRYEDEVKNSNYETRDLPMRILNDPNSDNNTKELAKNFIALLGHLEDKIESDKLLKASIEGLERNILKVESSKEKVINSYSSVLKQAKEQTRNLQQYEAILTKDVYNKVSLTNYEDRPSIIYFKEYEELIHFSSFIETLYDMFRNQLMCSCKVLFLFDSSSSKRIQRLPHYYKVLYNKYQTRDLITEDFIVKVGDYNKIYDFLFTNKNRLDLLLIIDCKDHNDGTITGTNLYFNLCRNENHAHKFNLPLDNTIVNNSPTGHILSWNTYGELKDLNEDEERFLFLSSRPIMQHIYGLAKIYNEVL